MEVRQRRPSQTAWSKWHPPIEYSTLLTSDSRRYERHFNSTDDPFAALYNLTNANNGTKHS